MLFRTLLLNPPFLPAMQVMEQATSCGSALILSLRFGILLSQLNLEGFKRVFFELPGKGSQNCPESRRQNHQISGFCPGRSA